jgi:hypothetical protein
VFAQEKATRSKEVLKKIRLSNLYLEFSVLQCWPSQVATCFLRRATNCMPSRLLVGSKIAFNMTSTIMLIDGRVDAFFTCLLPLLRVRWYHCMHEGSKVGAKVEGLFVKFKVPPCKGSRLIRYFTFWLYTENVRISDYCRLRYSGISYLLILPFTGSSSILAE